MPQTLTQSELRVLISQEEAEHMILGMQVDDAEKVYDYALSKRALHRAYLTDLRKHLIEQEKREGIHA